jgi:hypothetical protein
MEEKKYPFVLNELKYQFLSISDTKTIKKVVLFTKVGDEVYNLALLDELDFGELSDITESKNNDLITILSTVMSIIDDFLSKNKESVIIFRGSDEKRQRLYRIAINNQIEYISKKFIIFGAIENNIVPFESNTNYEYYLIKKR